MKLYRLAYTFLLLGALHSLVAVGTAEYLNLPLRPFNAAIGGQVAHTIPVQAAAAVNPAYLGYGSQNAYFAGGVVGQNLLGFFADAALFSPFGGLGVGADFLQADDKTAALRFSYGSFLSKHVATGLSLTPRYTASTTAQAFGFGIDPSLLIDSKWHKALGANDGFGLYSPAVFLATQNLAIPIGESNLLAKPSAHVGFLTGLYQSTNFNWALTVSTYGSDKFDRIPLLVGVQTQYRWLLLSAGYSVHNTVTVGNGFSLGVGGQIPASFGDTFFFYSLNAGNDTRSALHSFTAGVRLGGVDNDPPDVVFESEGKSFSPDDDGVRDLLVFQAKVTDKSPIVYYELRIDDAKGNAVFRQKSDNRIREKDFSFPLFFRSFISPRAKSDIPERFTWNGKMSAPKKAKVKDKLFDDETESQTLPDGAYSYEFWVIDEKNNESKHITGSVEIDTKKPLAAVDIDSDVISPNGDGNRDILVITQDVSAGDSYEATIQNAAGQKIRSFSWKENAPTRVDFDGKTDSGALADEGVYRYRLLGSDGAGNRSEALSANFYVSRRVDSVFLKSSAVGINPAQKQFAAIELFPSVEFGDGYLDGEIAVQNTCKAKAEDAIFKIAVAKLDLQNSKEKKSSKKAQPRFAWKGEALGLPRAKDGAYCLVFRARYANGNIPESPPLTVVLDSTPPDLDAVAELAVRQFTPDGDGENEEQIFRLSASDLSAIASYTLAIDEVLVDGRETKLLPLRRFQGQGDIPQTIFWDGQSDSGNSVDSLVQYQYTLTASDVYGNTTTTQPRRFETGVLAPAKGGGFVIRLTQFNLEDPLGEKTELLYNTLRKYPKYKLKIEVHAATGGGIERSLKLTESTARKIYAYLVDRGIAAERIGYQGFGDAAPIYRGILAPKNNRVEIVLSR